MTPSLPQILRPGMAWRRQQQWLALLPALLILLLQHGMDMVLTLSLACCTALASEVLGLKLRRQALAPMLRQGDALLFATQISLLLWQGNPLLLCGGCAIAILLRHALGGSSLFHPAAIALVLASAWQDLPAPTSNPSLAIALLSGILWLGWRGILRPQAMAGLLAGWLLSLPLSGLSAQGLSWQSGSLWLLAGWVMSEGASSPATASGRLLFGLLAGMLCNLFCSLAPHARPDTTLAGILLLLAASVPLLDRALMRPSSGRETRKAAGE